jgi:hypothetical protein
VLLREPERGRRWIAVLVASLAVHVGVLAGLSAAPHATVVPRLNVIDVSFNVTEPSPREVPLEPPVAPPPPSAPPAAPPVVAQRSRKAPPPAPIVDLPPVKATAPAKLDPKAAARSYFLLQQAALAEGSEGGEAEAGARANDTEAPNYFKGVGEKHYLTRREPPSLKPHKDGTYRYRGVAFKAIVEKDGSVTFDDGYRQGATVRFDMTDMLMRRRGEDPYRVEKNWFLKGTAEFRAELFERWKEKQTVLALRKLRTRLYRLFADSTLSDDEKEARVIAMLRDTADDDVGAAARKTIAQFIATEMPSTVLP